MLRSQTGFRKKVPLKKNRIIWFSAAASLVLVITLSIFLINKTQKETESNIALNDVTTEDSGKDVPAKELEMKPVETPFNEINAEGKEAKPDMVKEWAKQMPLEKLAEENLEISTKSVNEAVNTGVAGGAVLSTISQNQVDLTKNKDNTNISIAGKADSEADAIAVNDAKAVMPVAMDSESSKKKTKEEEKNVSDEVAATNVESLSKAEAVAMNEKANDGIKFKERKVAKKVSAAKSVDTSPMYLQNTATTSVPGYLSDGTYRAARYEGEDSAIKTYILDYLKNKTIAQTMKGSFKINGTVNEKGKLVVESVTSVNNECKDCETTLKNALNEMPHWQPAMQGGKAVSAKTSFALKF